MLVVLYSDASFNHHNGAGGWAVWLESEGHKRVVHYGSCPSDIVSCANHAELFAIHMGLQLAYREWGDAIHAICIRSDSECALRHARKGPLRSRARDREMLRIRTWIHDFYQKCGVQVIVSHVKGHQDPALGHAYAVNNNVDRLATRGRKAMAGAGYLRVREALGLTGTHDEAQEDKDRGS